MLHSQWHMSTETKRLRLHGFTIVELMIVIIVIAILVTVTVFAYSSIRTQTTTATLNDDLHRGATALESYKSNNGKYPLSLNELNNGKGISASGSNEYLYVEHVMYEYCLEVSTANKDFIFSYDSETDKITQNSPCPEPAG